MVVAIITLSILFILASLTTYMQYTRANKLEEMVNILSINMQNLSDLIKDSREALGNPALEQAFSEDDEVGRFFRTVNEIQNTLNNFIIEEDGKEGLGE